jgi:uncharacterized repeat protein (TIGR03803 family)
MNNGRRLALLVSAMCFGVSLGALIIFSLVGAPHTVRAQNPPAESVLYSFSTGTGMGGYYPSFTIAIDSAANIYGTTIEGDNPSSWGNTNGCGTIFEISPNRQLTILHTFATNDIFNNFSAKGVIRTANGTLYGTTAESGIGGGTVFKRTSSGSYGVLHTFTGGTADGYLPVAVVVRASTGNLYGTTLSGGGTGCGGSGCGTIYEITSSGQESLLHSFTGGADGYQPASAPILDSAGDLYGTAEYGGDLTCPLVSDIGCGTVWKLDTSGNFTVLYPRFPFWHPGKASVHRTGSFARTFLQPRRPQQAARRPDGANSHVDLFAPRFLGHLAIPLLAPPRVSRAGLPCRQGQ